MALKKVAGSKISIGRRVSYKDTVIAADFSGASWTEIKGWTEVGELTVDIEVLTQLLISTGITQYGKGVMSFPTMSNGFTPLPTDPGQVKMAQALLSCSPYEFKIEWGADCGDASDVTISPTGVVTWTAHGQEAGQPITFTTTGALPTGLTAGTQYFIVAAGLTTNTFTVALTAGGAAIVATAAGSGLHSAFTQPIGETDLFYGLVLGSGKNGGDANAVRTKAQNIQPICKSVEI